MFYPRHKKRDNDKHNRNIGDIKTSALNVCPFLKFSNPSIRFLSLILNGFCSFVNSCEQFFGCTILFSHLAHFLKH